MVLKRKQVVEIKGWYYLYCEGLASWYNLHGPDASTVLNDINAPINYAMALSKFYKLIELHSIKIR